MFYPYLMNIKLSDMVLEIGPGTCPYWRSDVLADRFEDNETVDRSQFGGGPQVTAGKPFVLLDGPCLPFADKQFDYLICSQVLEHVPADELPELISEFSRVARHIYIEVPRPVFDITYDFDVHLNFIDIVGDEIVYIPKRETAISSIRNMSAYCRSLREKNGFSVENAGLSIVATGKEFSGKIGLVRAASERAFFEMSASSRFKATPPTWRWRLSNLLQRNLNWIAAGRRRKSYLLKESNP